MSKTEPTVAANAIATPQKVVQDAATEQKIVENDHDIFLRGLLSIMVLSH
ncbi:MAG: hypothetical protein RLZZ628_2446 [Bacteroidota bacterium]|jgi:hypothetical protein